MLTSTGNETEFDKIAAALVEQHTKIHIGERPGRSDDGGKKPFRPYGEFKRHANLSQQDDQSDEDYDCYDD